jgi:hypothetical protein
LVAKVDNLGEEEGHNWEERAAEPNARQKRRMLPPARREEYMVGRSAPRGMRRCGSRRDGQVAAELFGDRDWSGLSSASRDAGCG